MKYTLKYLQLSKQRTENVLIIFFPAVRLRLMSNGKWKEIYQLKMLTETNFIKTQFIFKS